MANREPFRLSRLRDLLLGVFAVFAVGLLVAGLVAQRWTFAIIAGCVYALLIGLGRHPRAVFFLSIAYFAIAPFTFLGRIQTINRLLSKDWAITLVMVLVCGAVMFGLSRLMRTRDWQYGPPTTSDKVVVACILIAIPVGLLVLLSWLQPLPWR